MIVHNQIWAASRLKRRMRWFAHWSFAWLFSINCMADLRKKTVVNTEVHDVHWLKNYCLVFTANCLNVRMWHTFMWFCSFPLFFESLKLRSLHLVASMRPSWIPVCFVNHLHVRFYILCNYFVQKKMRSSSEDLYLTSACNAQRVVTFQYDNFLNFNPFWHAR